MARRSSVRLGVGALVLTFAYGFAVILFAMTAVLGPLMFMNIPFLFALPPLFRWAHRTAGSLAGRRPVRHTADFRPIGLSHRSRPAEVTA